VSYVNNNLTASTDAAAEVEEAFRRSVESRAAMVRSGEMSLDGMLPAYREAVRQLLEAAPKLNPRQFFAQQNADRMQFFRDWQASGHAFHRVSKADHAHIFGKLVEDVDAGIKTAVRQFLRDYGTSQGYAPDWAESVADKPQPKKTQASLAQYREHQVFVELREDNMLTRTHQAALQEATYAGIATLLSSWSKSARERTSMQAEIESLKKRMAAVEAEATRANIRLDMKDAGEDWKEKARAILAAEPGINNSALARRVGKSESAVRKYKTELTPALTERTA
jgi:hypothetical protein